MKALALRVLCAIAAALVMAVPSRADDDDFEKKFRERQKKYDEMRRDSAKKFEELRREGAKREAEWQRKWHEQYREDLKRQDEWRKKQDKEARKEFEEQLRRQMRGGRGAERFPNFGPPLTYPPPLPFGAVPDETRLPAARWAATEYAPVFSRALTGLGGNVPGFDPRAARVAADLAQRSERLADFARRNANLADLRREYAALDAGWRQLVPYLDRAVREPAGRDFAWRLYEIERQIRSAIGYDARAAGPDWATAHAAARDQVSRLEQIITAARNDGRLDVNLLYDIRNAQREAQGFEQLVARRAPVEELRPQHDFFAISLDRVMSQLQSTPQSWPIQELLRHVVMIDRWLSTELGLPVYQEDAARAATERAGELRVAADRLRREMWSVLGGSQQDVISYYVHPTDQLASHADLVHQTLSQGRPMELVQAGWQRVLEWTRVVGERVRALDPNQYPTIHQLAADTGRLVQEVHGLLRADHFPPNLPPP
jgi:hypothetical protein